MTKAEGLQVSADEQAKLSLKEEGASSAIEQRLTAIEARLLNLERRAPEDRVSMVVFSGEMDRVLAAFVIATGAASMGMEVSMFFTFWGLSALRKKRSYRGKRWNEKMMALMTPGNTRGLPVSKLNFFGIGSKLLRKMMRDKNVASLEELIAMSREFGVNVVACQMSMDVMGVGRDELADGIEVGGAATFLGDAARSRISLFI
jgi:peroxiredoxin family protein